MLNKIFYEITNIFELQHMQDMHCKNIKKFSTFFFVILTANCKKSQKNSLNFIFHPTNIQNKSYIFVLLKIKLKKAYQHVQNLLSACIILYLISVAKSW